MRPLFCIDQAYIPTIDTCTPPTVFMCSVYHRGCSSSCRVHVPYFLFILDYMWSSLIAPYVVSYRETLHKSYATYFSDDFTLGLRRSLSLYIWESRAQPLLAEELPLEFHDFASYPLISADTRPTNISIMWWDIFDRADSNCLAVALCDLDSLSRLCICCLSYRKIKSNHLHLYA
jgi:hypothetical protein